MRQRAKIYITRQMQLMLEMDSPQCHEANVAGMGFYAPLHAKWPTTDHYHPRDPEHSVIRDVNIDVMTKAYATVQMPAQIGPNQCLRCKVYPDAGDNIMPMHVYTKLPSANQYRWQTTGSTPIKHPPDSLQWIYHPPTQCPLH